MVIKRAHPVFKSHPPCSVGHESDNTSNIDMKSSERNYPRISRVIDHKIVKLTQKNWISPKTLKWDRNKSKKSSWVGVFGVYGRIFCILQFLRIHKNSNFQIFSILTVSLPTFPHILSEILSVSGRKHIILHVSSRVVYLGTKLGMKIQWPPT